MFHEWEIQIAFNNAILGYLRAGGGVPRSFVELPETRNLKLQAPWQIRSHSLGTPSHITASSKNLAEAVWVWFYYPHNDKQPTSER